MHLKNAFLNAFKKRILYMTIHTPIESPGRVDKKYIVFKMFTMICCSKNPKNSE
jgi:hypothetical protein